LNSWLRDSDRVSLFEFFRDKVLEYKDDTNRSFTDSILYESFCDDEALETGASDVRQAG